METCLAADNWQEGRPQLAQRTDMVDTELADVYIKCPKWLGISNTGVIEIRRTIEF